MVSVMIFTKLNKSLNKTILKSVRHMVSCLTQTVNIAYENKIVIIWFFPHSTVPYYVYNKKCNSVYNLYQIYNISVKLW